ncbi:hypothetical protein HDV05_004309 [Chytridiales sp. JEL 0842]|nr:hypothetical protein HDV05_004309 [Chytridiales sp. JEL 0842]
MAHLLLTLALLSFSPSTTLALPNGAPRCAINPQVIQAEHGAPAQNAGFTITASSTTYTPGGPPIQITYQGPAQIQGILSYVQANSNPNSHVGQFNLASSGLPLRTQTPAICTTGNITNEAASAGVTSTFTHSQPLRMSQRGGFTIQWTPPATNVGPVTLRGVMTEGSTNSRWMVMPDVALVPAGGSGAPTIPGPVQVPPPPPSAPSAPAAGGQQRPPVAPPANPAPTTPTATKGAGKAAGGKKPKAGAAAGGKASKAGEAGEAAEKDDRRRRR